MLFSYVKSKSQRCKLVIYGTNRTEGVAQALAYLSSKGIPKFKPQCHKKPIYVINNI
jgi:hypothetical protein